MKTIITLVTLMAANIVNAQTATERTFELIPAVRTTVTVEGEFYVVARDENNKIVFVKTQNKNTVVKPMLINVTEPEEK